MQSPQEDSHVSVDPSKKQAILERNRASSMRCRAKRKAWVEQLQQSLKMANATNASLQAQVRSLNAQVAKLKALLLAHKDCPVTKAMEKGKQILRYTYIIKYLFIYYYENHIINETKNTYPILEFY